MVSLNVPIRLPKRSLWYLITVRGIFGLILIGVGLAFLSGGSFQGTCTTNGVASPCAFSGGLLGGVLVLIGVLIPLWAAFWYFLFSYTVTEESITITSGVLLRRSKSINFVRVQNVEAVRGPLQMLFGLASLNIWTASQDQITFSAKGRSSARPDGKLYLLRADAEELKNYIASKGAVQAVRSVSA